MLLRNVSAMKSPTRARSVGPFIGSPTAALVPGGGKGGTASGLRKARSHCGKQAVEAFGSPGCAAPPLILPGVRSPTRSYSLVAMTVARSLPSFDATSGIFTSGCCGRGHGICEVGGVVVDAAAEEALAAFLAAFAASVDDWACSGVPSSRAIATAVEAIAWFLIDCSSLSTAECPEWRRRRWSLLRRHDRR